ncbi:1-acyl-sn-glycerol-3-phosphate acyltransferase [bacterium]|nr:1-acyl-sn-glycerol-3-phosphate acyltransferase [bacterium]
MRFARIFADFYFRILHNIDHRGARNWPRSGPLIIISNHPTYWDPWLIGMGQRERWDTYWMTWEQVFDWPVIGPGVRAYQAFPVDLDRPKVSTLRRARAVLDAGCALGIFPEGNRTSGEQGELDPWKPGAGRLALLTGAPVLPVSIKGARACWPRQRAYPLPGKIAVTYHPILDPGTILPGSPPRERERALTEKLRGIIASAL